MISIIIPTFNEEKFLPHLLNSLHKQTFKDFEVIVADNNSADSTRAIALKAMAKVVSGGLPARGRNNGARVACGEWLLFLDADVILPPDFLEKAKSELTENDFAVASCYVQPLSEKRVDKFLHKTVNQYFRYTKKFFLMLQVFVFSAERKFIKKSVVLMKRLN